MKGRITKAAEKALERVRKRFNEPAVREAGMAEIRAATKESPLKKLKEAQDSARKDRKALSDTREKQPDKGEGG